MIELKQLGIRLKIVQINAGGDIDHEVTVRARVRVRVRVRVRAGARVKYTGRVIMYLIVGLHVARSCLHHVGFWM